MSHVARFLDPGLVERLSQLQLSARSVVEGTTAGLHRSALKGASVEFRQHRIYAAGDEPRRLDWRVLARTDRPYVREYQEETNLRALIVLDRSGSMGYGGKFGTKLQYASQITAALAYLMLGRTESVGLAVFAARLEDWLAPQAHASAQLSRVIDVLERTEPASAGGGTSSGAADVALHEVADRLGRRSLVIVLSDLFLPIERLRRGLARLRHDRHEVIAMQVLDKDELEFPFSSFARFHGLEDESPAIYDAALLRKKYLFNLTRHQQALEETCRTLGAELARFITDRPLDEALISFLRRRAVSSK
ncbi:MAG TPA: DUF58 domain-containing protein [Tepidisphaeraceae bacterium]|jgi:uncharacterized protein (DUF58 family)